MRKPALLALAATLLPGAVRAAGMDYPDNGTTALGRGAAFVARADNGEALYYNPAGLASQGGLQLTLETNVVDHDVEFLRRTPGGGGLSAGAGELLGDATVNQASPFVAPFATVSYGFSGSLSGLTLALGAYGPPSVGRYEYNRPKGPGLRRALDASGEPVDGSSTSASAQLGPNDDPTGSDPGAPGRYALVDSDLLLVYPTLAVSYRVHRMVSVGVSLQYVYASLRLSQVAWSYPNGAARDVLKIDGQTDGPGATTDCPTVQRTESVEAGPCAFPNDQTKEHTYWDTLATIDVQGKGGFTGILGVLVGPWNDLSLGLSFRPPVPIDAEGTLETERSPMMEDFEVTMEGDRATLELTLPPVLRAGVRYDLSRFWAPGADVELDYVYEGWSTVDQILVRPEVRTTASAQFVRDSNGGQPLVIDVPEIRLVKNWEDTHSIRLGGDFTALSWLTLRGGYIFETGAIPTATASIDFPNLGDRHSATAGLTLRPTPWLDVTAAYAHIFETETEVTDSEVRQITTDPGQVGNVIGNGTYSSAYDVFSLGLGLRFASL